MRRLFLLTAVASIFMLSNASAQKKDVASSGLTLGVGAEFAAPTGNFHYSAKLGVGGSLLLLAPISNKLTFTGSAGFLSFSGNTLDAGYTYDRYNSIPLKAGLRYSLTENIYVGAESGVSFKTGTNNGASFIYAPGVGIKFPVAGKSAIDIGARYEGTTSSNKFYTNSRFVGLRIGYNFGL